MRHRLRILVLILGLVGETMAADYYVSNANGKDANSGTSPSMAWKTIARVNAFRFQPGDRVLLHSGEMWDEQLRPSASGTQNQPIVFSSYGAGARPALEGNRNNSGAYAVGLIRTARKRDSSGDVAIDNNDQSHIVYDGFQLRHVLEGLRIYVWSGVVQDITLRNCLVEVEASAPNSPPSSTVYANVHAGRIVDLNLLGNHLVPYPRGLEHWGIYFVAGVEHFRIDQNAISPAGEDGITVWHASYGEISHNRGGGNGENTIDVKDSHDVIIRENWADFDQEYNIVVHGVDSPDSTYDVRVEDNHCSRGGQGGQLSAGIALLFVEASGVEGNLVEGAAGEGILIKDAGLNPGNWASGNRLIGNGVKQKVPAIVLQGSRTGRLWDNEVQSPFGAVN